MSALQKYRESQSGTEEKQLPAFLSQNNADILETIGRKVHIVIAPSNGVNDSVMKHHQIAGHERSGVEILLSSCPAFIFSMEDGL